MKTELSIMGIAIGMFLIGMSFSPSSVQGSACPIDQIQPLADEAKTFIQEGKTNQAIENIDSIIELTNLNDAE